MSALLALGLATGGGAWAGEPTPAPRKAAVLLYDGALLLDFGIAAEMLLAADGMKAFQVVTVAVRPEVTISLLGRVHVDERVGASRPAEVVIVPGGMGWPEAAADPAVRRYLAGVLERGGWVLGVCSGSLLLAKAGLLAGRHATTNAQALPMLSRLDPSLHVESGRAFVRDGRVVTTAGAGTAIDATLHLVRATAGDAVAQDLARRYLNYHLASPPAGP